MREMTQRMTMMMCTVFLMNATFAHAGYRCGPDGRPDSTNGCKCPHGKKPGRDGKDWVCLALPHRPAFVIQPPVPISPPDGTLEVDDDTEFDVSAPPVSDTLQIEICDDKQCSIPVLLGSIPVTDGNGIFRAQELPAGRTLLWRARGFVRDVPGPWCPISSFTTSRALAKPVATLSPKLAEGRAPVSKTTHEVLRRAQAAFAIHDDSMLTFDERSEIRSKQWTRALVGKDNTTCLQTEIKSADYADLWIAMIGDNAILCLTATSLNSRNPLTCWGVELAGSRRGMLASGLRSPPPGRWISVEFYDHCTRGYCLPAGIGAPADRQALMVMNLDASKVAVLASDTVHIYDAASRAHESSFSIRGDKGVTSNPIGMYWNGDAIFVEASNGTTTPIWVFKADGTPLGPIMAAEGPGNTVPSTRNGSFMMLDRSRVAISEQGLSSLTIYEIATGKRTKVVRKVPPSPCKNPEEIDGFMRDPSKRFEPTKCESFLSKHYAHLINADAVSWNGSLLVALRGPRLGELAVLDAKTLAERQTISLPWCN